MTILFNDGYPHTDLFGSDTCVKNDCSSGVQLKYAASDPLDPDESIFADAAEAASPMPDIICFPVSSAAPRIDRMEDLPIAADPAATAVDSIESLDCVMSLVIWASWIGTPICVSV